MIAENQYITSGKKARQFIRILFKANQYFTVEAPHGILVSLDRVVKKVP